MYLINPEEELSLTRLGDILMKFQTNELPRLKKYKHYFQGKQAIIFKEASDTGKPCNKIVTNFCHQIVKNFGGFLTGKPVTYAGENLDDVLDILHYNDPQEEDTQFLENALIYGIAYEINYIDEDAKQRFKVVDSQEMIPVYDATLNQDLRYCIRFWREAALSITEEDKWFVEVYGPDYTRLYKSNMGWTSFELLEERPNFFESTPVTVLELEDSIFAQIMSLQDSYNTILSASVDDIESFADAYMVIKGMTAEEEDITTMKQHRVLLLDPDASAEYLTKSVSDQQVEDILTNIKTNIQKVSQCPDFQDPEFVADSGVALKYKMVDFFNCAAVIKNKFIKALQRRVELICSIINLTATESIWRDIQITVSDNLPNTLMPTTPQEIMQLKGLVSDETLLTLLPFVKDPSEELKKLEAQNAASVALYATNMDDPYEQ